MEIEITGDVAGQFRFDVRRADGSLRETLSFPNRITNGGLNRMGDNADWLVWCQVGAGSTAPQDNDSALVNRLAGTDATAATVGGTLATAPYYTWRRVTKRFTPGQAVGNISEVGMGWASTAALFSRALVLDAQGNPTTISVGASETLDVTYEFRYYPKLTDTVGETTFTGNLGGGYSWIFRPSRVATSSVDGPGWGLSSNGMDMGNLGNAAAAPLLREGAIGPITGSPAGAGQVISLSAVAPLAYEAGSYRRRTQVTAGLSVANFPAGVRSIEFRSGIGTFQMEFTPPIPKTADDQLSLTVFHSWARRP